MAIDKLLAGFYGHIFDEFDGAESFARYNHLTLQEYESLQAGDQGIESVEELHIEYVLESWRLTQEDSEWLPSSDRWCDRHHTELLKALANVDKLKCAYKAMISIPAICDDYDPDNHISYGAVYYQIFRSIA